ncbi:MAG: glycoside hydrolase family 97 protein [Firmicutes bacterium]|nr:glycoside hydrolase family 97 protein [Bacillota bacterium]MCM1400449.1 glycoside hydrolase family 97 protein [Bacteroides sp.]
MKNYLVFLPVALLALGSCSKDTQLTKVTSPDNRISLELTRDGSQLSYSVSIDGEQIINPSALGFTAEGLIPSPTAKMEVSKTSFDETWAQPWGENKEIRNHYNEMALTLTDSALTYTVRVRAFNDGVAFRYEWDAAGRDSITVMDELTEFAFATPTTSWSIPADFDSYEKEYRTLPVDSVANANTPFTFMTDSSRVFGSIHEAALYDFPEMTLAKDSTKTRTLKAALAPMPNGVKAVVPAKFATPWRTIQTGGKAVDLINSAMILNLNEPCKIKDLSWIKPQKYVGIWWGMHLGTQTWIMGPRHGATTENAIKYIDFAAANNIQGVLFEGWNEGWENWGGNQHFDYIKAYADFNIESIASYAKAKGIELWAHNETGGNIPEYEAVLDSAFAYYHSLGIHTVKTGYAGGFKGGYYHHSQYGVRHYQKVVETAAKYQLMLDAHEPIKETGIRRTWPNMMTREGARGMEWNAWSEGNSADYLCILPFTRLLSGPMDYTPGIFDINYKRAKSDPGRIEWNGPNGHCSIKTTLARQIANWVIIYSPLQMAADQIENYENQPGFQFFRDFNADCDWSEALQGEIGEYIVTARRAGETFFVGAGTNASARTLTLPLSFLKKGVTYTATIYADDVSSKDPEKLTITQKKVTSTDSLEIAMLPTGGQAITFTPVK